MPESQPLVADLIVECLEREGVTHVFGIPGEENIHLVDALSRSSSDSSSCVTSKGPHSWPRHTEG